MARFGRAFPVPQHIVWLPPAGVVPAASDSATIANNQRFLWLDIGDRLFCQSGRVRYGALYPKDLLAANEQRSVEDQESLTFSFSRLKQDRVQRDWNPRAITAELRPGRVVQVVWENRDVIDEWRIASVITGRGLKGVVSVTCVPIWLDLVERSDTADGRGWVSEIHDGERVFDFEIAERTGESILQSFFLPYVPDYVTLGTIEPTVVIDALSITHLTPWAVALAVRDAYRNMDIPCELQLRATTTGYKLDLVTQIAADVDVPIFHPTKSLVSLTRREDATLQATRLFVRGGADPNGFPGSLGRARWKGVGV
jgi:hypothetical protein